MPRNVFAVLDEVAAAVQELRSILEPFAARTGGTPKPDGKQTRRKRRARTSAPSAKRLKVKNPVPTSKPRRSPAKGGDWRRSAGILGGLMRRLSKAQQAEVRKVKDEKGLEPAIETAKSLRAA